MENKEKVENKPFRQMFKFICRAILTLLSGAITGLLIKFLVKIFSHLKSGNLEIIDKINTVLGLLFVVIFIILTALLTVFTLLDLKNMFRAIWGWIKEPESSVFTTLWESEEIQQRNVTEEV